jgi:hypothetical protein
LRSTTTTTTTTKQNKKGGIWINLILWDEKGGTLQLAYPDSGSVGVQLLDYLLLRKKDSLDTTWERELTHSDSSPPHLKQG